MVSGSSQQRFAGGLQGDQEGPPGPEVPEEGHGLVQPPKEEQLKPQNPQTHSRTRVHTHTHTHTHLLPECPVPAAPAPSGAAQEWGPHCSQEGPLGRRHRKGAQGHDSTWRLCRPAERSPCKAYGQMDQAQLPFQDSFSLVQNSQNCSRRR